MIGDVVGQVLAGIGGLTVGLLLVSWAAVSGKTLASWLRYKRAERAARSCCPACQLQYSFVPLHRGTNPPKGDSGVSERHPYTRESGPQ